jgi:hypothetical protein
MKVRIDSMPALAVRQPPNLVYIIPDGVTPSDVIQYLFRPFRADKSGFDSATWSSGRKTVYKIVYL